MPATELQRKAIYLIIFVGINILILSALPFVESWLQTSVFPPLGMDFGTGWELTKESGTVAMNVTYASATDTFFRILKIVLWMAIIIAIVRFIAYLALRAAVRNQRARSRAFHEQLIARTRAARSEGAGAMPK